MESLELWNKVCETDPGTTKEVGFGRKFTAIDAYSQIKKATELWGPYGRDWGLTHIRHTPIDGTTMMLVEGYFKYPDGEPQMNKGGDFPVSSSIFYISEKGKPDDDFAKKVETDLITKALSRLGFNADVFMGKFDDNRYVQSMREKFKEPTVGVDSVDMERVTKAADFLKKVIDKDQIEQGAPLIQEKYGLLSSDEKIETDKLLSDKAPDSNRMYRTILKDYLKYVPE